MTRTAAALVLATLALTAGGSDAAPDAKVTVTVTATPTVTAATPTPTPCPSETPSDEPNTPAAMATVYREDQPINAPWRFPVTGISEKDGVSDVLTTLTSSDGADLAVDVCGEVHAFLLDRAGSDLARIRVKVRDADLRVVADNLDGRCKVLN